MNSEMIGNPTTMPLAIVFKSMIDKYTTTSSPTFMKERILYNFHYSLSRFTKLKHKVRNYSCLVWQLLDFYNENLIEFIKNKSSGILKTEWN
jgi:hypothetical protein